MRKFLSLLQKTVSAWMKDNAARQAAALAYYGVLSIAPLLVIAITIAGVFFGRTDIQMQVIAEARDLFGPSAAQLVNTILNATYNTNSGLTATVISLLVLFIGATNIFFQLKTSLNHILDAPATEPKKLIDGIVNFVKERLRSAVLVIGVGVVILLAQVLNIAIGFVIRLAESLPFNFAFLLQMVSLIVPILFMTLIISLVFRYLPDIRLTWREVLIGGFFTAVLFAFGQRALSFYFENSDVASAYGVAGSFVVVLLWIYYASSILLFGAEFMEAYAKTYGSLRERDETHEESNV